MNSFPFESKNTGTSSAPQWDRAITAEMERSFKKMCYTNGVFASPVNGLLVSAAGGMKTRMCPGGCLIEGAIAYEPNQREFAHSPSSATLSRVDRIVCRFDTADDKRNIEVYLKEGVPATTPSPQGIIRQSNYYEIVVADILIPKGATEITNSNITDQRMNKSLCGMVVPAIPSEQPTEELWAQIKDSIDLVNSALSGTTAGNIQAQVTALDGRLGTAESDIDTMEGSINTQGTNLTTLENLMKSTAYAVTDPSLKYIFGNVTLRGILTALNEKKAKWGPLQTVSLPFTAPSDGMLVANTSSNGSAGALYLSENSNVLGATQVSGGGRGSICFPVSAGQAIKVFHSSNITGTTYAFRPFI